jgi:hypothetical protein
MVLCTQHVSLVGAMSHYNPPPPVVIGDMCHSALAMTSDSCRRERCAVVEHSCYERNPAICSERQMFMNASKPKRNRKVAFDTDRLSLGDNFKSDIAISVRDMCRISRDPRYSGDGLLDDLRHITGGGGGGWRKMLTHFVGNKR